MPTRKPPEAYTHTQPIKPCMPLKERPREKKHLYIYTQKPPRVADPKLSWSNLPWTGNLLEQSSLNANLIFGGVSRTIENERLSRFKSSYGSTPASSLTHGSMANTSTTTVSSKLRVYSNMYTRLKTQKAQNPPTEIKLREKRRQDRQTRKSADRCAKTFLHTVSGNFRRREFPGMSYYVIQYYIILPYIRTTHT